MVSWTPADISTLIVGVLGGVAAVIAAVAKFRGDVKQTPKETAIKTTQATISEVSEEIMLLQREIAKHDSTSTQMDLLQLDRLQRLEANSQRILNILEGGEK